MTSPLYKPGTKIAMEEVPKGGPGKPEGNKIVLRDKTSGKFLKITKRGAKIAVQDVMEATAQKICKVNPETGLSPLEAMVDSMIELSQSTDPKCGNAAVKAFQSVTELAWGQSPKSDLDRQAEQSRVKIVIVQHPELMNMEVKEYKPHQTLVPAFAEVEGVYTNPKTEALVKVTPAAPALRTGSATLQQVETNWLLAQSDNDSRITTLSRGKSMAAVTTLAENEPPLRMDKIGRVTQGLLKLAAAFISGAPTVSVLIEDYDG